MKHLRFDLRAIFRMALADGVIETDPTPALYTPTNVAQKDDSRMTPEQIQQALTAVPQREKLMLHLALLAGMRPGEFVGLQRRHASADGKRVVVEQRVYDGKVDRPKTYRSKRVVELGPATASLMAAWLASSVKSEPEAWVFSSEADTPLRPNNVMKRIIRPALKKLGMEWVKFQTMRRTHADLGHEVDPKVMADQRGHAIGVAIDVYTKASPKKKAQAAKKLEQKVLPMPERKGA